MPHRILFITLIATLILFSTATQARGIVEMAVFKVAPDRMEGYLKGGRSL